MGTREQGLGNRVLVRKRCLLLSCLVYIQQHCSLLIAHCSFSKPQSLLCSLFPVPCSLFPVLLLLSVTSCSNISGKLLVIEANFLSSQGRFTEAVTQYTKALDYEDAAPYVKYGLGTVYFSMGEEEAALDNYAQARIMLDNLPPNSNRELRCRVCYNMGVAQFSAGNFSGAAESFRDALKIDGRKTEAKRNLELSILSIARQNIVSGAHGENEGVSALFDYIRQKELDQWANREWQPEEDSDEPDY
jgi:tetratricopeptide (TPR) repeat protein